MKKNEKQDKKQLKEQKNDTNECPIKDKDGNCLVPGVYNDSEPIGGGG